MRRTLSPDSNLESLKKDAKRWLKALRAGDPDAHAQLRAAYLQAPPAPGLRDVQLALARAYGLSGWAALRAVLGDLALARQSQAERIDIVLRSTDWQADHALGARILTRWPETGRANLFTAVATGNLPEVEHHLAGDPAAADRKGGPLGREPLHYLAYSRLPGSETKGLAIAQALLDAGADPNARWVGPWGEPPFTVLTGVIGEGEGFQPPHPQAREFADLLIARGADPFDPQALYNTSLGDDDTAWLDFLWAWSERRGRVDAWRAASGVSVIGGKHPASALDYLLGNAVAHDHRVRAGWLLVHGAAANSVHAYSGRPQREEALVHGFAEMAALLVQHGAAEIPLTGNAAFRAAVMRLDRDAARALAERHPRLLTRAEPMLTAARQGRTDIVALLLALGVSVDAMDKSETRGLHVAIAGDSLPVVKLLVAHGADVDRPTLQYGGPMGFASHFQRREIAAYLAGRSRDVHNLVYLGFKDRLMQLFAEDPSLVNGIHPRLGCTPLFILRKDEDEAIEMADFLLAHGADPTIPDRAGNICAESWRRAGYDALADRLQQEIRRTKV